MASSTNVTFSEYSALTDDILRKLKMLMRSAASCKNEIENKNDIIAIAQIGNKLVGVGCISSESPKRHFPNETDSNSRVPYLHNFICDPKYRKHKVSVTLINAIKNYVSTSLLYTTGDINANIILGQEKPIRFFTRNDFVRTGSIKGARNITFECYTYYIKK